MPDHPTPKHSPYAAPQARVSSPTGSLPSQPPVTTSLDPSRVDPSLALRFPFRHPDWWRPALQLALTGWVPVYGLVLLLGWFQRIYDGVRRGTLDRLPEVSWAGDFTGGLRLFGSVCLGWGTVAAALILLVLPLPIIAAVLAPDEPHPFLGVVIVIGMVGVQLFLLLAMIVMQILGLEMCRRALNGDTFAVLRWKRSFRVILAHPFEYVLTITALIAAFMGSYLGIFACYVGLFFTFPLAAAAIAHALAQWDNFLEHHEVEARH